MERDEAKKGKRQDNRETFTIATTETMTTADSRGSLERLPPTSPKEQAAGRSRIDSSSQVQFRVSFLYNISLYPVSELLPKLQKMYNEAKLKHSCV